MLGCLTLRWILCARSLSLPDKVTAATCEHTNLDDCLGLRELDQHLQKGNADCWGTHPRHGLAL